MTHEFSVSDFERVHSITAKDRSSLYVISQFLEDEERYRAFVGMYAIMRLIDDAVDDVEDKQLMGRQEKRELQGLIDDWQCRIERAYQENPLDHAIDRVMAWAVHTFPVPQEIWMQFLDAMRFDIDHACFQDFDAFLDYCVGASAAPTTLYVYLLTSSRDAEGRYIVEGFDYRSCGYHLGVFAYIAHILRDVATDALLGQTGLIYLSKQDLERFHLTDRDVRYFAKTRMADERFTALTKEVVARAKPYLHKGLILVDEIGPKLSNDRRFALNLAVRWYQKLLEVIEEGTNLFAKEKILSSQLKLKIAMEVADELSYELSPSALARMNSGDREGW